MAELPSLVRTTMMKGRDLDLTRADIDRIPYASIAVRMGDGPQALLILGRYDGEELNWISAKREVIVTRRGRVVKTYGLPTDVKETVFLTPDPVGRANGGVAEAECLRTLDLDPSRQDGILVRSRFAAIGSEAIEIFGERVDTALWQEQGGAPELQWSFTNRYWVDPHSGYVWKSRQSVAPALPPLDITVTRRAA